MKKSVLLFVTIQFLLCGEEEIFVYYLFENPAGTSGCSDCYIPMLITKRELSASKENDGFLVITYERQSIYEVVGEITIPKISGAIRDDKEMNIERQIYLSDIDDREHLAKFYRYQEVGTRELDKLLENPEGDILLSRVPMFDDTVDSIERWISDKPKPESPAPVSGDDLLN